VKTIRLNKAPPMAERPRCPQCQRPLAPYWYTVERSTKGTPDQWYERMEWRGEYRGYGHFCTTRCAVHYANDAVERERAAAL
jgi:hypothetical protein